MGFNSGFKGLIIVTIKYNIHIVQHRSVRVSRDSTFTSHEHKPEQQERSSAYFVHLEKQTAARCGPWPLYVRKELRWQEEERHKTNDLVWQWIWHRSDLNYPLPFGGREGRFVDILEMSTNGTY